MFKGRPEKKQKHPNFGLPLNLKFMNAFAELQKQHLTWVEHRPVVEDIAHALFKAQAPACIAEMKKKKKGVVQCLQRFPMGFCACLKLNLGYNC